MLSQDWIEATRSAFLQAKQAEAQLGLTQAAADKEDIARARVGAENGPACAHFSQHGDIREDLVAPRRVTASENALKALRGSTQSPKKIIEPTTEMRSWQGQAQKEAPRRAAHGRDVAYSPGETFPANRVGWVLITQKVGAFQEPVARQ